MTKPAFWAGRTVRETFDSHWVEDHKTGCWVWQRSRHCTGGYGQLNIGGRPMLAHRFSWERTNGKIPPGMQVMHKCDNPACVRPGHLELGTNLDNIIDKRRKGRERPGSLWRSRKRTKPLRRLVAENFDDHWAVDEKTGCWIWQLALPGDGYGMVALGGKKVKAHRFAFERVHGEIPKGAIVRHRCDNRACVNPKHLKLGTQQDNIRDMCARGRQRGAVGVNNIQAKLTPEKVVAIRLASRGGATGAEIAKVYGISGRQACNIIRRVAWSHVA